MVHIAGGQCSVIHGLLTEPVLVDCWGNQVISSPSALVLQEPGHSYVFLALGNSESVNVMLALFCLKNYPMFASSVTTSSSCCISSEMTLDHHQCKCNWTNRIEMLESFVIYATLSDSTAVHPKYITLAVQNQAHRCVLLIQNQAHRCVLLIML